MKSAAMQNTIDRFFDNHWRTFGMANHTDNMLAIDLHETDNAYTLVVNVPGVDAENIDVTVQDNILSISAEINEDQYEESDKMLVRERAYGRFSRRLALPRGIDVDSIESDYDNGVLTLNIPKNEVEQRRRIPIRVPKILKKNNN